MDHWTLDHVATLVAGVLIALGRIVPSIAELARNRAKRLRSARTGAGADAGHRLRRWTKKSEPACARRVRSRACVVTAVDSRGIQHRVEVMAGSLFEAGILAIAALRKAGSIEERPGIGTRLEIEVREPAVRHVVTVGQLQRWVSGPAKRPAEQIRRERMRELLEGADATSHPSSRGA